MIFELEETVTQNARMKVVGIGGGGGNALNRMVDEGLNGVEFVSVNTDAQALMNNKADVKGQIAEMRKHVDTMVVVPNERLLAVVGKGIPFQDALKKADEVLLHATQGISSLISVTGIVNVDFADVRTVMQNGGAAIMGTGTGRGENRAMEAVQQAISSPLLDNISIAGATGVLINITGGEDLTLGEVTQISDVVKDAAGEDAEIIFGPVNDPAMHGEIRVTVIATGFEKQTATTDAASRAAPGVLPFRERVPRPTPVPPPGYLRSVEAAAKRPLATPPVADVNELEIPTFIRRQMD